MKSSNKAFTLIELIVVIATVGLLAVMLVPALASAKSKDQRISCIYNIKQIGLAFRLWEGSHNDRYPMAASAAFGGANEFVAHSSGSSAPIAPFSGVYCPGMAYMVMSNELSTSKVLYCPSDNIHTTGNGYATNFSYGDLLGIATPQPGTYPSSKPATQPGENAGGGNSKISYFVNADALGANPQDIMTGDDNIGNNGAITTSAVAQYRFGAFLGSELVSAASSATCVGITSAAFNGSPWWAWTANDFHRKSGNLGMTDGSCQSVTISGLHSFLSGSTNSASAEAINFMP